MRPPVNPRSEVGYHDEPRPLTEHDMEVMRLPRRFWAAKRDDFPIELRQRDLIDNMTSQVPRLMSGSTTLALLYGPHGTGKTSAAAVILKAVRAHRYSTFFLDVSEILRTFPSEEMTGEDMTYRERAYQTEALLLDGLGDGYATNEYVASETLALVKHRQDNLMLTIITTSLDEAVLQKRYGPKMTALLGETAVAIHCPQVFAKGVSHAE